MATYNIRDRANLFRSGQVDTTDIADGAVSLSKVAQDVVDYIDTSVANVSVDLTGYATETYVTTAITNLVDTAPTALDTLNELAAALGDDPNFATTVTTALGNKANTSSLATVATSGSYTDLTNKPTLFSGSYTDLTNKPTLFSGSYTDLTNKPTIPTATSSLTNDSGFITASALSTYATQSYVTTAISNVIDAAPTALDTLNELAAALGDDANFASTVTTALSGKQATLVSGTNIKTINGTSVLGSGDIVITGASDIAETAKTISSNYTITSTKNAMSVGPITIASGVTVTVPSGSRWVVI